jgi:hypothetical protein
MIVPLPTEKSIIMKKTFILLGLIIFYTTINAQNYFTRTAHINVKSANKVQNIVADNYQVACQLNASTGQFKMIALIKSFEYQIGAVNRIMDTRNVDVTEYPKITYDGKIANLKEINFSKPGSYPVKFKGMLFIWDEKRVTDANGTLTIKSDGTIEGKSNFTVSIEEVNTQKIDMIMRQKLPVSLNLQPNTLGISKNIQINATIILKKQ